MLALHMAMQVRPPQTSHITVLIRTVVPEQQDSIFKDFVLLILDTQVVVDASKVSLLEILEPSHRVVGKGDEGRFRLFEATSASSSNGADQNHRLSLREHTRQ